MTTNRQEENRQGRSYNGADEYIYNQTEANDTIRMSQEEVNDFDGITIDQSGQEVHDERLHRQAGPGRDSFGGFSRENYGENPFRSNPGFKIMNFGGLGCIVALLILALVIGLFFAGIIYFAKYILIGAVILGILWGFGALGG